MLQVPRIADLTGRGLAVSVHGDGPGPPVVSVEIWANDGDNVRVSWYEWHPSVGIRWTAGDVERLALAWEHVTALTIDTGRGRVDVGVDLEADGLAGRLWVHVGDVVQVSDVLLVR